MKQYQLTKCLPISEMQKEWPDEAFVKYDIEDFGNHKCQDCVIDHVPWKKTVCEYVIGVSTSYGGSSVKVCMNNLVEFGCLQWWEKMGTP